VTLFELQQHARGEPAEVREQRRHGVVRRMQRLAARQSLRRALEHIDLGGEA
jgi:hypothetical protein